MAVVVGVVDVNTLAVVVAEGAAAGSREAGSWDGGDNAGSCNNGGSGSGY